jgi:hypothetical protein
MFHRRDAEAQETQKGRLDEQKENRHEAGESGSSCRPFALFALFCSEMFFAVRQWVCGGAPKPAIPRLTRFATKLSAVI